MMLRTFLVIITLSFLASCTVTKRVHRSGYHIEWKKHYSQKSKSDEVAIDADSSTKGEENETALASTKLASDSLDIVELKEENSTSSTNTNSFKPLKLLKETAQNRLESLKGIIHHKSESSSSQESYFRDSKTSDVEEETGNETYEAIAIFLLVIGGLICIVSLMMYFGFSNSIGDMFNSLVLSGNGFIVGFFGFLLFLILLVILGLFYLLIQAIGGYVVGAIVGGSMVAIGVIMLLIQKFLFKKTA